MWWLLDPGAGEPGLSWGFCMGYLPCLASHACFSPFHVLGQRLVSPGSANETSSILVESVTRSSTETCYSAIPKASSDASKVTSKGAGLSKAFVGQKSSFLVDCSKAGRQPGPARGMEGMGDTLCSVYFGLSCSGLQCPPTHVTQTFASNGVHCPVLHLIVLNDLPLDFFQMTSRYIGKVALSSLHCISNLASSRSLIAVIAI